MQSWVETPIYNKFSSKSHTLGLAKITPKPFWKKGWERMGNIFFFYKTPHYFQKLPCKIYFCQKTLIERGKKSISCPVLASCLPVTNNNSPVKTEHNTQDPSVSSRCTCRCSFASKTRALSLLNLIFAGWQFEINTFSYINRIWFSQHFYFLL